MAHQHRLESPQRQGTKTEVATGTVALSDRHLPGGGISCLTWTFATPTCPLFVVRAVPLTHTRARGERRRKGQGGPHDDTEPTLGTTQGRTTPAEDHTLMPPLPQSTYGMKRGRKPKADTPTAAIVPLPAAAEPPARIPTAPKGLSAAARRAWKEIHGAFPDNTLSVQLDAQALERCCRLLDERERWKRELDRGLLLEKPVQNARGEVLGTELYSNPAAKELRAIDRQLDAISDRLGLHPAGRARLGLVLSSTRQSAARADQIVASKWAKEDK